MLIDENLKRFELEEYRKDIINLETQYLNLTYHPVLDKICTREEYDRTKDLMKWTCAICGCEILISHRKYDVENFVCDKCKKDYNNKSSMVDHRILESRTKLYKLLEDRLYQELEDVLSKGNGEV